MFFVKSLSALLSDFLDLTLPKVSLSVHHKHPKWHEWKEHDTYDYLRLEFEVVISCHIKVVIAGWRSQFCVTTWTESHNCLTLFYARHFIARFRWFLYRCRRLFWFIHFGNFNAFVFLRGLFVIFLRLLLSAKVCDLAWSSKGQHLSFLQHTLLFNGCDSMSRQHDSICLNGSS